jgi:hypothetical protein
MSYKQGMQMFNAGMGLFSAINKAKSDQASEARTADEHQWRKEDRVKAQEQEALSDEYFNHISQGKNVEQMEEYRGKVNGEALKQAHLRHTSIKLQDPKLRKARNEVFMADAEHAEMQIASAMDKVAVMQEAGDIEGANAIMAESYNNFFPNGDRLTSKGGKFYEQVPDGKGGYTMGEERDRMEVEQYMSTAKKLISEGKFKESYVGQKHSEDAYNSVAFANAEEVVDKNGNFVGRMAKFRKDGKEDWQFSAKDSDGTVPWADIRDKEVYLKSEWQKDQKFAAGLAKSKSETAKNKAAATKQGIKPQSPEGKMAFDLARDVKAFDGNQDAAMRFAMEYKKTQNIEATIGKMVSSGMFDEEDAQTARKYMQDHAMKVPEDKMEVKTGLKKEDRVIDEKSMKASKKRKQAQHGAGIPEKASKKGPTKADKEKPPVEGAKKAKDGNWYIKKDGQWYRVKN